jgi:RHS repeat-associated protein
MGVGERPAAADRDQALVTDAGQDHAISMPVRNTATCRRHVRPRMVARTRAGGGSAIDTYTYNGDGLRATTTSGSSTKTYTWDNNTPNLLSDGTTNYLYGPHNTPIEQLGNNGSPTYLHADQYGSTRLLTNTTGAVVATYNYTPYGQSSSQTGATNTALKWNGQYQDHDTTLYYLCARYYDPTTAQFTTPDPLTNLTSRYTPTPGTTRSTAPTPSDSAGGQPAGLRKRGSTLESALW